MTTPKKPQKLTRADRRLLRQLERSSRADLIAEATRWGGQDGRDRSKTLADNPYIDRLPWNAQRRAWNRAFIAERATRRSV